MKQPWFRCYSETLRDRKIERVSRDTAIPKAFVIGIWNILLMLANDSPVRGVLLLTEEMPLTFDDLQYETGVDAETLLLVLNGFLAMEMVELADGTYFITKWQDRQFASDSSAERVRRFRERQNGAGCNELESKPVVETVTPGKNDGRCNVSVTLQGGYSNAPETETETETNVANAPVSPPQKPPRAPPGDLEPDTKASRMLMGMLQKEAHAKKRRGPKKFPSLACKQKFDAAAERLGDEIESAIKRACEVGALSVPKATDYVAKWNVGSNKPKGGTVEHRDGKRRAKVGK